jgi:23S rRNA (pseudouridine1915-N3)-methyltransferase
MKFSDVNKDEWTELQPYLDTCLLPVTGLTGVEQPWQATEALEKLRDALELIEIPYKGRVVTYPALHYVEGVEIGEQINTLCSRLREAGFAYVVVLTIDPHSQQWTKGDADEIFYVDMEQWTSQQRNYGTRSSYFLVKCIFGK